MVDFSPRMECPSVAEYWNNSCAQVLLQNVIFTCSLECAGGTLKQTILKCQYDIGQY